MYFSGHFQVNFQDISVTPFLFTLIKRIRILSHLYYLIINTFYLGFGLIINTFFTQGQGQGQILCQGQGQCQGQILITWLCNRLPSDLSTPSHHTTLPCQPQPSNNEILIGTTSSGISHKLRNICHMQVLHINGKLTMGKLK